MLLDFFDPPALFYTIAGLVFLGFLVLPVLETPRWINVPTVYVLLGAALAWLGLPAINPLSGGLALKTVEHATELIVIVSIAGAGLAVDRRIGARAWHHTWMLLGVTMPLTIAALTALGWGLAGLPLATAVLLGAALSPTDPVLARSVQVPGPGKGEGHDEPADVRVSLTTEAGLNDGLAFPFVYLAIALVGVTLGDSNSTESQSNAWLWHWLGIDLLYRLAGAIAIGWLVGAGLSRFVYSNAGDAQRGRQNAGIVLLAGTFLAYGLTELAHAYGFLAVFVAARVSRSVGRAQRDREPYEHLPHRFSDQIEKALLALLLLWLGGACAAGILSNWHWHEPLIAAALVFLIRPLTGFLALWPTQGTRLDHLAIATLGIRGFGTVFYVAYAHDSTAFPQIDAVWRIATFAILISIAVHGVLARYLMQQLARPNP